MSSSNSPCAACKCLRRKCTQECVFAPYFPPDNPQKFTNVHKVFGASNVAKLLNELPAVQREDAVNSLAYEAELRLRDPVFGCVGLINFLQHKLKQVHQDIDTAKRELSAYLPPGTVLPMVQPQGFMTQQQQQGYGYHHAMPYSLQPMMGLHVPTGVPSHFMIAEPHQQQIHQQHHLYEAPTSRELEMLRNFEQQQQQQQQSDLVRYNAFDEGGNPVSIAGYNQIQMQMPMQQPSVALVGSYDQAQHYHNLQQQQQQPENLNPHQQPVQVQQQQTATTMVEYHQQQQLSGEHEPYASIYQQQLKSEEEGKSNIGPFVNPP